MSAETRPILTVSNISKQYKLSHKKDGSVSQFNALNNISFQLKKGDRLGIIGTNGSGKTTLLKILSEAVKPTSGQITYRGKLIPIIDIGSGFHPDISGRENIFMYGAGSLNMNKAEIEKNLNSIIEFSELGQFIDEPIKNYSNGMYLRLALSVALFCELDILLLDEIFSVGDGAFMLKCIDKMNHIIQKAATVILVSHNMNDILRVCSQCIWLENGEIKMIGETNEVVAAYTSNNELRLQRVYELNTFKLTANKQWDSPADKQSDYVHLKSISIRNEDRKDPQLELDYNTPIAIDIYYNKLVAECEIGFTLMISDKYGVPLLVTSNALHPYTPVSQNGTTGNIKNTCMIPAQLFGLDVYKVSLFCYLNNTHVIFQQTDLLSFRITTKNPTQEAILKKVPVKFAAPFNWIITKF